MILYKMVKVKEVCEIQGVNFIFPVNFTPSSTGQTGLKTPGSALLQSLLNIL